MATEWLLPKYPYWNSTGSIKMEASRWKHQDGSIKMSRRIYGVMEVRGTLLKEMVGVGGGVDGELEYLGQWGLEYLGQGG